MHYKRISSWNFIIKIIVDDVLIFVHAVKQPAPITYHDVTIYNETLTYYNDYEEVKIV